MRPKGSPQELERRRRRAVALLEKGYSQAEAAQRVGCHPSSVMRWREASESGGEEALRPRPVPGRPPKLTAKQKQRLVRRLLQGPMKHGYRTDLWTTARIAEVIERVFGVTYHRDHVGRLLHQMGWSHQKPERRAAERNQAEIDRWLAEDWPKVKKTPAGWAPISSS